MIGFAAVSLGMFLALLDIQIVAGSLKDIQGGLSASDDEMSAVQTSYLIGEIIMIPLSGWLATVFSTRWLFTASAAAFTLSSLMCGAAWSIESMVVARVIQGFVGGAMIPLAFSVGFAFFSGRKAALIPAILGVMGTLAPTLGPVVGGWITDALDWRYLFYLNLLPGLLIVVATPIFVHVDEPDLSRLDGFDALSIPFIAVALGCLGYVLEEGVRRDWFDDDRIRALTLVSAVAWVVVIWRGLTHPRPVLDLRAFLSRDFTLGCIFAFVLGVGNYGVVYVLPVFLGKVRDFNSLDIGEAVFVTGVVQVVTTAFISASANRIPPRVLLATGLAAYGASLLLFVPLTNQWGGDELFWGLVLRGFASMAVVIPITSIALGGLPKERLAMASGLFNLMRNLGGAAGIAGIGIMLQERQTLHFARIADNVTHFRPEITQRMAEIATRLADRLPVPDLADHAAIVLMTRIVKKEALVLAVSDTALAMAVLYFATLLLFALPQRPVRARSS